jgi:hypothetical protein
MLKMVQETLRDNAPDQAFTRKVLENLPRGRCPANSFAQGLHMMLEYSGAESDFDTIMGDTGQAFIIQSEEGGPLIDGAVDVGWWPMAAWGLKLRLEFLGRTVGREVREIKGNADAYRADPAAHYRTYFEREVKASISSRRPALAERGLCFVVAGYDDEEPPLLGDCSLSDERMKMRRIEGYPWSLIVLGEEKDRIDRKEADRNALVHAVALGRDALQLALPAFAAEWEKTTRNCFTGQRSFALWAEALRDTERLGQARWYANMCLHLRVNRRSAIPYLREMAGRRSAKTAEHLTAAADIYDEELRELGEGDTSKAAMMCKEGRERLARLVERLAKIESQAIAEIERAMKAMDRALSAME